MPIRGTVTVDYENAYITITPTTTPSLTPTPTVIVNKGRVSIEKKADDESVFTDNDGTYDKKIKVEITNKATGEKVATISTNSDGYSSSVELNYGTYIAKEVEIAGGSMGKNLGKEIEFTINESNSSSEFVVTFTNEYYKKFYVKVLKKDGVFGARLNGAEFAVEEYSESAKGYKASSATIVKKTDANSLEYWETSALKQTKDNPEGKFRIVETKAPDGYELADPVEVKFNDSTRTVEIDGSAYYRKTVEIADEHEEYVLRIKKVDAAHPETALAGAEFSVKQLGSDGTYVDYKTIGSNEYDADTGVYSTTVKVTKENMGRFLVTETKAPENYAAAWERYVDVTASSPVELEIITATNEELTPYGKITLTKTSSDGGVIPTDGVFRVYEWSSKENKYRETPAATLAYDAESGKYVTATSKKTLADGRTIETSPLAVRIKANSAHPDDDIDWNEGKYLLVEETAPTGFVASEARREITFTNADTSVVKEIAVSLENTPNRYEIIKTSTNSSKTLKAKFSIWTADGSSRTLTANGSEVTLNPSVELSTDNADKKIVLEKLPVGTYYFRETEVEDGYQLDTAMYTFTVNADGTVSDVDEDGKASASTRVINMPKVELEIVKKSTDTSIIKNGFPKGTSFKVEKWSESAGKWNAYASASYSETDEAFVISTGSPVMLTYDEDSLGKYRVTETKATPGYIISTDPQEVTVPENIEGNEKLTVTFENKPNRFELKKVSVKGDVIEGASFVIRNVDNSNYVYEETTGEDGLITLDALAPGRWVYQEVSVPSPYKLDNTEYSFIVNANGTITASGETGDTASAEVTNGEGIKVRVTKVDSETGFEAEDTTGFPAGTVFAVYEWDKDLNAYRSIPSRYITYATDAQVEAKSGVTIPDDVRVAAGDTSASMPKTAGAQATNLFILWKAGEGTASYTDYNGTTHSNLEYVYSEDNHAWVDTTYPDGAHSRALNGAYFTAAGIEAAAAAAGVDPWDIRDKEPGICRATYTKTGYTAGDWRVDSVSGGVAYRRYYSSFDTYGSAYSSGDVIDYDQTTLFIPSGTSMSIEFTRLYTPNTYTVNYDANGGTGSMSSQSATYDTAFNTKANTFTRDGYTFAGWTYGTNTYGASTNGVESVKNLTATANGSVTLKAKWVENGPDSYTLSYNYDGGYLPSAYTNPSSYTTDDKYLILYPAYKSGYDFTGYRDNTSGTFYQQIYKDGTFVVQVGDAVNGLGFTGNRTFTAEYEEIVSYTITFDYDGGTLASGRSNPSSYNDGATIRAYPAEKDGYTFTGYKDLSTGTVYNSMTSGRVVISGMSGNKTFQAQWEKNAPDSYAITYDYDGGELPSGKTNPASYTEDDLPLTLNAPEKDGYTFTGFKDTDSGTTYTPDASGNVVITDASGELSLKAVWEEIPENEYVVAYQEGWDLISLGSKTFKESELWTKIPDITYPAHPEAPIRFWSYYDKDGAIVVQEPDDTLSQSLASLAQVIDGNKINIRIHYDRFNIGLDSDGGTKVGDDGWISGVYPGDEVTLPVPTKAGSVFKGWQVIDSGKNVAALLYEENADGTPKAITGTFGYASQDVTLKIADYKYKDATYEGGSGSSYSPATMSLKALWDDESYTITYDLDGGTADPANPESYTATTETFTLTNPVKPGKTFTGWEDLDNGVIYGTVTIAKGSKGDRHFKAHYADLGHFVDPDTYELAELDRTAANEGKFMIKEVEATEGYILDMTPQYFTADDADGDGIVSLRFEDQPNRTEISKIATDNSSIAGAVFEIAAPDGTTMTRTSDADGNIIIERMVSGTWRYKETAAPAGYSIDPTEYSFIVNDRTHEVEGNDGHRAVVDFGAEDDFIMILKEDQNHNPMSGIVFNIVSPSGNTTKETTDKEGNIIIETAEVGTYKIQEAAEQPNYPSGTIMVDTTAYEVVVTKNGDNYTVTPDRIVITNDINEFELVKTAEDGETKLNGAEFRIWNEAGSFDKAIMTGSEEAGSATGAIKMTALEAGTWHWQETKAPDGYVIPEDELDASTGLGKVHDFTVTADGKIEGEKSYSVTATNERAVLKIKKTGEDSSLLEGVTFHIWNSLPEGNPGRLDGEYTTDADGMLSVTLPGAGTYHYQEVSVPDGYVMDTEIHDVLVESGKAPAEITVTNATNSFKLQKTDEETGDAVKGAEFTFTFIPLVEGHESVVADSTHAGNEEGSYVYTTDDNGVIEFAKLAPGTYTYQETKAPEGYEVTDGSVHTFEVRADGRLYSEDEAITVSESGAEAVAAATDRKEQEIPVTVRKVDAATGEVLEGCTFELLVMDGDTFVSMDPARVSSYNEDTGLYELGTIKATTDDTASYKIVETKAPAGYVCDYEQVFTAAELEAVNGMFEAENRKNAIRIRKVDENGDTITAFEGFNVWKKNADPAFTEAENGIVTLEGLAAGTYYYAEDAGHVPDGFLPDGETDNSGIFKMHEYSFKVNADGTIKDGKKSVPEIEFTVTDYTEKTVNVAIHKTDENGELMEGCTFEVYPYSRTAGGYLEDSASAIHTMYDAEAGLYRNMERMSITAENEGKFLVKETGVDKAGYAPGWEQEITFPVNTEDGYTLEVEAVNEPNEFDVLKLDTSGNTLAGVTFTLSGEDGYSKSVETGSDGIAAFKKLMPGVYTLEETSVPEGYAHSNTGYTVAVAEDGLIKAFFTETNEADGSEVQYHTVMLEDGTVQTVAGVEETGRRVYTLPVVNVPNVLRVRKMDIATKQPIEGVTFEMRRYDQDPQGSEFEHDSETGITETRTRVTDADGYAEFSQLTDGVWLLVETKVPEGVKLCTEPRAIRVIGGIIQIYNLDENNAEVEYTVWDGEDFEVTVDIDKIDAVTGERIEATDGMFGIWPMNTENRFFSDDSNDPIAILTYDAESGLYKTKQKITATDVNQGIFLVKEIKAPTGYQGTYSEIINTYEKAEWHLVVENTPTGTQILIRKYDGSYHEPEGIGNAPLLNGAVFRFWKDGEEENAVEYTTGDGQEDGVIQVSGLDYGTYHFQEVKAPAGYILDDTDHVVTIGLDGMVNLTETTAIYDIPNNPKWNIRLYTGGVGRTGIYTIGGILFAGLILLVFFRKRRKSA